MKIFGQNLNTHEVFSTYSLAQTLSIGSGNICDHDWSFVKGDGLVIIKQEDGIVVNPLSKESKAQFSGPWSKLITKPTLFEAKDGVIVIFPHWSEIKTNENEDWDVEKFPKNPLEKNYPEQLLTFVLNILGREEGGLFIRTDKVLKSLAQKGLNLKNSSDMLLNRFISEAEEKKIFKINFETHSFLFRAGMAPSDFFILRSALDDKSEIVLYLPDLSEDKKIAKGMLQTLFHLLGQSLSLHLASVVHKKNLYKASDLSDEYYWGDNSNMLRNKALIDRLVPTDLCVVINGETGVGKEGIAQYFAKESGKHLVAINCSAIPENLAESVLFGHEKGSFTGAIKSELGKIREAHLGILFLDEIGELSLDIQAKLLRFLQTGMVTPVGGKDQKVKIRLISATHRDLGKMVTEGKFREDLFYRINEAMIVLPPLRERVSDIEVLSTIFLNQATKQNQLDEKFFLPEAIQTLISHSWPGNIRELKSTMRRLAILSDGQAITNSDVEQVLPYGKRPENFAANLGKSIFDLNLAKTQFIQTHLEKVLAYCHGNKSEAAKLLGISQRSLFRYLSPDGSPGMDDDKIVSELGPTH